MELSVFGAFNSQGAAVMGLSKGSEADCNGSGFTEALSECIQSDGSASPEPRGNGDGQVDAPKDATPHPGRFHNIRKRPREDNGQDRGLDPNAPLQDEEPLEGATSVRNGDARTAVGLALSEGRRPADLKAQGIDNGGEDIPCPAPLYDSNAAYRAAASAPTDPPDTASASAGTTSGEGTDGLTPVAGSNGKRAQAAAGIDIVSVVSVNPGNGTSAASGQADEDNPEGQGDGNDSGGTKPQAVKGGFTRSERHGMTLSGVSGDNQAAGTEPARLDADKGAAAVSSQAAQGGSSGHEGHGRSGGDGLEGDGDPKARFVKDAGPSGTEAFAAGKPAEKTFFDALRNTDTRTHNVAANSDIYDRLDSGLNMAVTRGAKEVTISLHPEHLGAIRIRLNMDDPSSNAVSARITVDSMDVKSALDADAGALKEAFGRQGLKLDGYTIEVGRNAFGADGGDSCHPDGAGAWGGGGTGGFRDGPAYRGPGGWSARGGEMNNGGHNGPAAWMAMPGSGGSDGVDLFA